MENPPHDSHHRDPPHLFTLRIWPEELDNGQREWRGRLQYGVDGEVRHFHNWASLVAGLQAILQSIEPLE